jgi:MinD-like ATPase involved in chromosome partitioning or flagellar assembly
LKYIIADFTKGMKGMSIITFWSNGKEQVGKTLSTIAVATNMAIEHNKRSIIISTSYKDKTLLNCYYDEEKEKVKKSILRGSKKMVELGVGIQGLFILLKSGKITPEIITDYTKIVFKDRLELLTNLEIEEQEDEEPMENYFEIIQLANQYYDYVFVDLDNSIGENQINQILKTSDIIVEVFSQRLTKIREFAEVRKNTEILRGKNTILLISKYNRNSKYKSKNIKSFLNQKKDINVIPYNNLFFEAAEEGTVPDLFLRLRKMIDKTDTHAIFIDEVKKTSQAIIDRIEELKIRI